jgi:hypothetical protein
MLVSATTCFSSRLLSAMTCFSSHIAKRLWCQSLVVHEGADLAWRLVWLVLVSARLVSGRRWFSCDVVMLL